MLRTANRLGWKTTFLWPKGERKFLSFSTKNLVNKTQEPSEINLDPEQTVGSNLKDIFPERRQSHGFKRTLGGFLSLSGVSLFCYSHAAELLTMDNLAGSCVLIGGGLLFSVSDYANRKSMKDISRPGGSGTTSKFKPRFKFTLLNDHFDDEKLELNEIAQDRTELSIPFPVQPLLMSAQVEEMKSHHERLAQQQKKIIKEIEEELAVKTSVRRIKQKLQPRVYVLTFRDTPSSQGNRRKPNELSLLDQFAATVSLVLSVASPYDEVVIRLTSPGGAVTTYGHAAAQLLRFKKAGIPVTCCVDTVAASGGYMMASVANHVVASPFALLGSIGVVSGMPNVNKLLKKNDVDFLLFTAGKHKRTVHPLAPVTDESKAKYQEQLEDIHDAFQKHIVENRDAVNIEEASTGEAWIAAQAIERGLVDELGTSDEYIRSKMPTHSVIAIDVDKSPRTFMDLIESGVDSIISIKETLVGSVLGSSHYSPKALSTHSRDILK
eukprot:m.110263 g.110263  ORF g.110263 m.110263 type:complete len:494 (+) comp14032_c0_seq4:324-1805(+)